jgi:hypothetical protein
MNRRTNTLIVASILLGVSSLAFASHAVVTVPTNRPASTLKVRAICVGDYALRISQIAMKKSP